MVLPSPITRGSPWAFPRRTWKRRKPAHHPARWVQPYPSIPLPPRQEPWRKLPPAASVHPPHTHTTFHSAVVGAGGAHSCHLPIVGRETVALANLPWRLRWEVVMIACEGASSSSAVVATGSVSVWVSGHLSPSPPSLEAPAFALCSEDTSCFQREGIRCQPVGGRMLASSSLQKGTPWAW